MSYFFNIGVCLCLVILQTAIMPYLPLLDRFYDLLIPFIVYLGLSRPLRESMLLIFFLGFIMDNLSGSFFGLYLTTYLWLFIGVKGITKLIQVGNRLVIVTLIVATGVLAENLIFIGTFAFLGPQRQLAADAAKIVFSQLLWAICTGPLFPMIFKNLNSRLNTGVKALYARRSNQI